MKKQKFELSFILRDGGKVKIDFDSDELRKNHIDENKIVDFETRDYDEEIIEKPEITE